MNAGVRISPRRMRMVPVRARPSVAETVNSKRGFIASPLPLVSSEVETPTAIGSLLRRGGDQLFEVVAQAAPEVGRFGRGLAQHIDRGDEQGGVPVGRHLQRGDMVGDRG